MPNCPSTRDGIVAIIDSLSNYSEEGKRLYPKIIVTENVNALRLLLPQAEIIRLRSGPLQSSTYITCLNKCAPLTTGDWYIVIARGTSEVSLGIIRSGASALSPLPEQSLIDLKDSPDLPWIVIVKQVADRTVIAIDSRGNQLEVTFSGRAQSNFNPWLELEKLYEQIATNAGSEEKAALILLLNRIFARVVETGHGTLAIVVNHSTISPNLEDGMWLKEPLNLLKRVQTEIQIEDRESGAANRAAIEVVSGMLMSDGITAFDTHGCVLGFNVFAKAISSEERELMEHTTGGARHRTFELLRSWIGSQLSACMMVSHDGHIAYKGVEVN